MPALMEGPDTAQWTVWSTTARIVVTDAAKLGDARTLVAAELAAVELACSRFRDDSELATAQQAGGPVEVSPLLAELVAAALLAAERTDGDVDPTVATSLSALGYDRDISLMGAATGSARVSVPAPGWRLVHLDGHRLTIPAGIQLDLGATAKAAAADRSAAAVATQLGTGVLVSLGGDIATAGPAPAGGWRVLVQDRDRDPACLVSLAEGMALATSSTASRTWRSQGRRLHHIIDPARGLPADPVWRTVTAAAHRCVDANTVTTAAIVRGQRAPQWLRDLGVSARLVTAHGDVMRVRAWPQEPEEVAR